MKKVGIFLGSGGNKVFYVNGVLKIFKQEKIKINHLVGLSSASAIIFAHLFSCHDEILKIFGDKLKNNKKNFYFFGNPKFPHSHIYKSSIETMFRDYKNNENKDISYSIIATQTSSFFGRTKGILASFFMFLEAKNINFLGIFKKIFKISTINYDSRHSKKLNNKDLINLIMGSSTIYPFIDLHKLNNKLILEGNLAEAKALDYLEDFDKKIIIHTKKGKTKIINSVLHIYSSIEVPNDILDYRSDANIRLLQKTGEKDAKENIDLIKKYLKN